MHIVEQVEKFHKMFNHPVLEAPTIPSKERVDLRIKLIAEELEETRVAAENGDIVEVADGLGDLLYVVAGAILEFGLKNHIDKVFEDIHSSNMSKVLYSKFTADKEQKRLEREGKIVDIEERLVSFKGNQIPIYTLVLRETGKIIKPSTYQPVDLSFIDPSPKITEVSE